MKTLVTIPVQAILTFEDVDQDLINTNVMVPAVPMDMAQKVEAEVDVVEQILNNYAARCKATGEADNLDQLVKLSLCYTVTRTPNAMFEFLVRNNAKFFFQPNHVGFVETALRERIPGLASKTKEFIL